MIRKLFHKIPSPVRYRMGQLLQYFSYVLQFFAITEFTAAHYNTHYNGFLQNDIAYYSTWIFFVSIYCYFQWRKHGDLEDRVHGQTALISALTDSSLIWQHDIEKLIIERDKLTIELTNATY